MADPRYCLRCAQTLVRRPAGGRERLACPDPACDWVFWDNPTPVVAAIVERDGAVLLVRNVGWPESWYGLVTGFLERGETPEEGVVREVREELGLDATLGAFVGIYPFHARNELILAWHVRAAGEVELGEELAGYKVVPIEKLRPWGFGTGDAVRDWLARRQGG